MDGSVESVRLTPYAIPQTIDRPLRWLGVAGFQVRAGGSIEPPKTGGGGGKGIN